MFGGNIVSLIIWPSFTIIKSNVFKFYKYWQLTDLLCFNTSHGSLSLCSKGTVLTISSSLLAASISSCGVPLGSFRLSCISEVCCLILLSNSLILVCLQLHYHLSLKKITHTVWSWRQPIVWKIINTVSIYIIYSHIDLQYYSINCMVTFEVSTD